MADKELADLTAAAALDGTELLHGVQSSNSRKITVKEIADLPTGIVTKTASATLALTEANDIIEMNVADANVLTIPANAAVAFPVGTIISVTQLGAGVTSITADTGVTLNGVSTGSGDISAQYGGVSLYKRATDEWVAQGAIGAVA